MRDMFWAEFRESERWNRVSSIEEAVQDARSRDLSAIWICEDCEEVLPESCIDIEYFLESVEPPDCPLEDDWISYMAPTKDQIAELNQGLKDLMRQWRGKYNLPRWWQVNSEHAYRVEVPSVEPDVEARVDPLPTTGEAEEAQP